MMNWKQHAWVWKPAVMRTIAKTIHFDLNALFLTGKELPYPLGRGGGVNVAAAYSSAQTAYACIRRVATEISSTPIKFLSDPLDPKSAAPDNHPLVKLFRDPGPGYTTSQVIELFVIYALLRGDAFLTTDSLTKPTQLISHFDPMYWKALTTNRNGREALVGWQYRESSDEMMRLATDLIYFKLPSPYDRWRGQSPLQACSHSVSINAGVQKFHSSVIARGGESGILYKTPRNLTNDQYDQLRDRLRNRRRSRGESAEDFILEGGMDVVPPSFLKSEIEILALLTPSKEDICEAFGMSPSILGRANESNYSTFRGYMKVYWLMTLVPMLKKLQESFDQYTLRHYGLHTRWDISKVEWLQDYLEDRRQTASAFYKLGVTMRELNRRLDMQFDVDGIIGSDDVLANLSQAPMSRLIAGDALDAQLARYEQRQTPEDRARTATEVVRRAGDPPVAIPYERRLASIANRGKSAIRNVLLTMKKHVATDAPPDLLSELRKVADTARREGAAHAVRAADPNVDDAAQLVVNATAPEVMQTSGLAVHAYKQLTGFFEFCPDEHVNAASYNTAINHVSPIVRDLVYEAAAGGFTGRMQALGFIEEETHVC